MAEVDDSLFSRVLAGFRQRLSPQDINDFESTTFEDLKEEITRIQRIQVQRRSLRNLNKIKPFLNGIEQYSKVIEVFVNAKPDIMAFIWGPIKLCLQIASKLTEAFDALLDAYEKIGKSLPLFSKIEKLFLPQNYVQQVLVDVYEDILDFHKRAIIFFKQSAWRLAFKVTIHTFADMFGDVIKKLERSKELLLQSANIAHYQEAQEFRLLFAKEFDAQQERTKKDRMLTVIDWLSPTSCDLDHEELQRKRNEFPETTRWIFKQDSMRRWLQDGNSNPMLWICGIPGAGKTVLFSSIVDQIKHIIPHSQTIFFYCKNRDPLTKTFDGIARSLIAQLLQQNPVSLDYLYEIAVESGKRHPNTFKTYRDILEHITGAHDCLFIGIDGLDECEKEDRGFILSLLDHVLKASSPQAKIQILLTSQRMSDLQKLLKSALRFDIKPQHVKQDIESYVKRRALKLGDQFGFGHEKQSSITADVSNRSEGMFLLARLIMDNLMAQDNIEELEEELSTDILPKGINEAYGRILVRLSKSQHRKSQERATRVLELIITARYPLKIQELQGALSIRLEDMSVDFAKRYTVTSFNELCGPIVEVHVDDTISLVHPTAKLYLVQDHSGPFINLRGSNIHMANLCAQYLNFKCFGTLHSADNQIFVAGGTYAFQEYATLNWIYHARLILKPGTSYGDGDCAPLLKSCLSMISLHGGLLSVSQQRSSLENTDFEKQDLRAKLSLLQGVYDKIHSISDDEQSEDSMPYPFRHLSQTRSIIETSFSTANPPSELMTKAYGTHVFKCSVLSCSRFQYGYKNNQIRNNHLLTHRGGFECTHQGCDFSILGFSTSQELAKHMIEHDSAPDTIHFQVQRCSLKKSLETAIDQDDAMAVRALCAEDPDSLLPENLLKRAVNRKSREATKILLQVLPTEANTDAMKKCARMAMNLAAETGDVEMANLVIAIGADVGPNRSEINPLSIAARQGHAPIVVLLLNQNGGDPDLTLKGYQAPLLAAAENGYEIILRILMDKYGKFYAQNNVYYKAILSAGSEGHEIAVRILLETGYNLSSANFLPKEVYDLAPNVESMFAKVMQLTTKFAGDKLPAAALTGNVGKVLRLLKAGADINRHYRSKGTALSLAASKDHLTLVQELLDRGADINADGGSGAALATAVGNGHKVTTTFLLEQQADINAGHGAALHRAIENRHDGMVKLLLQWKANVEFPGGNGRRAIHEATSSGHRTIVSLLLEAGADINAKDESGRTALHFAANYGHNDAIVSLLLEQGAKFNSSDHYGVTALMLAIYNGAITIVNLLLEYGADVNVLSWSLGTALIQAADRGHLSIVKSLLERNSDVNQKTPGQETALHRAASSGHEDIVSLLLEHGADVSVSLGTTTALHHAADRGHLSIVKSLLEQNADVNHKNSAQETALHWAVRSGHENIVSLLLEHGADVKVLSWSLGTALIQAADRGHLSIMKSLLERNSDVNQKTPAQDTALHRAASNGHEDIVSLLLEHGADVSVSGSFGTTTALSQAADRGHLSIVKSLLERNADVNQKSLAQETALYRAVSNGHENVVSLLLEHGADGNAESLSLETPLMCAARMGSLSIVKLLNEMQTSTRETHISKRH